MSPQQVVTQEFQKTFGQAPPFIVRAPGRVNLIGEHTDYNLGYALPMAIDRAIWIALRPRADRRVWLKSLSFPEPASFSLEQIAHGPGWTDYIHGMAWALQAAGMPLHGWEGVVASDVPLGSGLSSSAAFELAVARAFWVLSRWDWDGVEMAQVAKRHENEWMGLKSGIMDQLISAIGEPGKAFLIDFRDLTFQRVPLPEGIVVVVMDTKVRRSLVSSAYNARVAECQQAAAYFGVESLRDVSFQAFQAGAQGLEEPIRRRARHVITENLRTLEAAERLKQGDVRRAGALITTSHASLRDDYQVSCAELDWMVSFSLQQEGCYGARMTGAGFGGCAIALVEAGRAEDFTRQVAASYEQAAGLKPDVYVCQAAGGAQAVAG